MFIEYEPNEFAMQLTLHEHAIYASVKPRELINIEWKRDNGKNAPNALKLKDSFDLRHNWVCYLLLNPTITLPTERAKLIEL